ncbi:MAG: hypothetical protein O7J95_10585 [Planctomycetota bacterium]|nr:hypothetical protein [Planctomycetota bacterium]
MGFAPPKIGAAFGALCVAAALGGCSSSLDPPSGDLRLDLRHKDPRIRVLAARQAVTSGSVGAIDLLISNLADRDGAVRFYTVIALRKLSGREFGYLPHGTPAERAEAIVRWKAWAADRGAPAPAEDGSPPPPAITGPPVPAPDSASPDSASPDSASKPAAASR